MLDLDSWAKNIAENSVIQAVDLIVGIGSVLIGVLAWLVAQYFQQERKIAKQQTDVNNKQQANQSWLI